MRGYPERQLKPPSEKDGLLTVLGATSGVAASVVLSQARTIPPTTYPSAASYPHRAPLLRSDTAPLTVWGRRYEEQVLGVWVVLLEVGVMSD